MAHSTPARRPRNRALHIASKGALVALFGFAGASLFIACSSTTSDARAPDAKAAAASDSGRVLQVGPGKKFAMPSAAAKVARTGDVIEIDAGVYEGDATSWRADNLTIRGVGGRAHLKANGADAEGKGIWVIKGRNTTVENIEFSGARVRDRNGAGIRQEGVGLTLRNCFFHDNQNGILVGKNPASEILIEQSEFANNGQGDGQTHNMYISTVKSFTLRFCYSHHARIGHNVKSRALQTSILYNRIMDEATGTSSYDIELSNGGVAYIIGNLIQQGPETDNTGIISYGAEGLINPANELYVINNTIVNDGPPDAKFIKVRDGATIVQVTNNIFAGPGIVLSGPGILSHNLESRTPGLVDAAHYDYHLTAASPAINAGTDPGSAHGTSLAPSQEYQDPLSGVPRPVNGALDIGAYEYTGKGRN